MRGRRGTSGGWSRRGKRCGAATIIVAGGRRCGRRVSIWSSTGACWAGCTCSARCWPGRRVRFVRFADNERAETTLALLAECFETLGGVPEGGAGRPDGLPEGRGGREQGRAHRRSTCGSPPTTGSGPDFCEAADPESKGIVENLVGYAKTDLMIPGAGGSGDRSPTSAAANTAAAAWCAEVNAAVHSEICAVPAERLVIERELLAPLPSLRAEHRHGR